MKKIILTSFFLFSIHYILKAQTALSINTNNYIAVNSLVKTENDFTKATYLLNNDTTPVKNAAYYFAKSKKNRNAGWGLLGTGAFAIGAGLLIGANKKASFDDAATGAIITIIGALCALGSIPCFISASANKQKAKLMFNSQKTSYGIPCRTSKGITGLTLSIKI